MADSKVTYEIIISQGGNGGGSAASSGIAGHGIGGAAESGITPDEKGFLQKSYEGLQAIKGFAPVAAVASVGKQIAMWQVSVANRNSGNSLMQRKIDVGMQLATQTLAAGGMILGGLITGNPLLVLGGVTSAVTTGLNYAKEQEQVNYERSWENMSLVYARERAGMSYNRSRTT